MNLKDDTIKYYERFLKMPSDEERVGWLDRHSQYLNFIDLFQLIEPTKDPITILDAGSGLCAFKDFLDEHMKDPFSYTGWELNPNYAAEAKKKYLTADIQERDFLESKEKDKFDYVFGSGLFSLKIGDEAEQYAYVSKGLRRLYELSIKGVGVNFLVQDPDQHHDLFYYSPAKILSIARNITSKFVLNFDFRPDQFSLFLRKNDSRIFKFLNGKNPEAEMSWLLRGGFHDYVIMMYFPKDDNPFTNYYYGIALFCDSKYKSALFYLERAATEPLAQYFLGFIHLKLGDRKKALDFMLKAQKEIKNDASLNKIIEDLSIELGVKGTA